MNNKLKYAILILLAGLLGLFLYNKYRVAPTIDFKKLPLTDLSGTPVTFESFKGKKLIVSFGASWCPNCIDELNTLKEIKENSLSDVEVIVISDEDLERVKSFKERKEYPFTFLKMQQPFNSIGVNAIPTTYIVNINLEVKEEKVGYINWEDPSTLEHLKKLME